MSASASASRRCCFCRRLVVVVDVYFASAIYFCCCRYCRLLVVFFGVSSSALASFRRCCIFHGGGGGGGVLPRGCFFRLRCLIVVIVVSVLSLSLTMWCSRWRWCPLCWMLLSALAPCRSCRRQRLVVSVCLSLSSAASLCCRFCRLLVVIVGFLSASSASFRCRCFVVVSSGVPSCVCFRRLLRIVFVVVVAFSSSSLGLLLLAASCFCRYPRLLVVVVVGGGVLSLSSEAASRISLKSFVYIRLTVHETTMDPQHQAQNGPGVLPVVWRLNIVWPSPQSKLTYPFVPKSQQVIGTKRELFERVLALLFLQQVPGLSNRCMFAL